MVRNCNKIKNLSIWVIQLFYDFIIAQWYFVTKVVLTYCSSDREKNLKFEAKGKEFANILRSLEQFVQTVKGQNHFW